MIAIGEGQKSGAPGNLLLESLVLPPPQGGPKLKFSSLQHPQFTFTITCIYLNYRKLSCWYCALMGVVEMAEMSKGPWWKLPD